MRRKTKKMPKEETKSPNVDLTTPIKFGDITMLNDSSANLKHNER